MEIAEKISPLVAKCMQQDRQAQYRLYLQYQKSMFNICYRMLNNTEDAEDILQEAFIDVFLKMDQYRGDATIGAWIKRIVIHKCISYIQRKKQHWVTYDDRLVVDVPDEKIDEVAFTMKVSRIQELVEQMPNGYRVVFSMFAFDDCSHKEIAQLLNISENTSKTQYFKAKKWIQSRLQDHG